MELINRDGLIPHKYQMKNGCEVSYFPDSHINLLKLDFIFEAGSALQEKKFQATTAIQLIADGTKKFSAQQIAEFLDFRGIITEKNSDCFSATLTVYTLERYVAELLPMLKEIIDGACYPQNEFDIHIAKRRHQLLTNFQKTSYVARNIFYEKLYGSDHPLGSYGRPEDLELLTVEDVRSFHDRYLTSAHAEFVLSGLVTEQTLKIFDDVFGNEVHIQTAKTQISAHFSSVGETVSIPVPNAVQNTLRVGRILPYEWHDIEYAQFMVLSTVVGGYFGSRLMSNLREDKGYTYGINALTQIFRGNIVFYAISDVAADKAEPAMNEILHEFERLTEELIPEEELELVRNCMVGDFMRSIDGIFERGERFCQMYSSGVTEKFTDNYLAVLSKDSPYFATAEQLREIARKVLHPEKMVKISAGKN